MVDEDPSGSRRITSVNRTAVLGAIALGVLLVMAYLWLQWGQGLSAHDIEVTIRSWGAWGVLASIGLMVAHSFLPFPGEVIAFANGMVYGAFWGTVITWIGAMLGAFVAFGLARKLGRTFVEAMVARNDWQKLDDWAAVDGWRVLLVSRFIPVIAFNLINYAAGLTRMRWRTFAWTTGVGILPLTTVMVLMGDNIDSLSWPSWLLLLAAGIALWFLLRRKLRP